jgi:hypothetical protein
VFVVIFTLSARGARTLEVERFYFENFSVPLGAEVSSSTVSRTISLSRPRKLPVKRSDPSANRARTLGASPPAAQRAASSVESCGAAILEARRVCYVKKSGEHRPSEGQKKECAAHVVSPFVVMIYYTASGRKTKGVEQEKTRKKKKKFPLGAESYRESGMLD